MTLNLICNLILLQLDLLEDDVMQLLILLGIVYAVMLVMRMLGVGKKRTCPSCSGKLGRKKRSPLDKLLVALTLNILPFRRYKCIHCGWEGLRWSTKKYKGSRDAY